jgi:hypothetical protein
VARSCWEVLTEAIKHLKSSKKKPRLVAGLFWRWGGEEPFLKADA